MATCSSAPTTPRTPSAVPRRLVGVRYDRTPTDYEHRLRKAIASTAGRLAEASRERASAFTGGRVGDYYIAATDGHRALLLPGRGPSDARDASAILRRLPRHEATLPPEVHLALKRVRTCAPRRSRALTMAIGAASDGTGWLMLSASDPDDGSAATEFVPLPDAPSGYGSFTVDHRLLEDAFGLWPLLLRYAPPTGADAGSALVLRPADDAFRYLLMPLGQRAEESEPIRQAFAAGLRRWVGQASAPRDVAPTPISRPLASAGSRPVSDRPRDTKTVVGSSRAVLWVGRASSAAIVAAIANAPDSAAFHAACVETPAYLAVDASRLTTEEAAGFGQLLTTLTPAAKWRDVGARWRRHCEAAGHRPAAAA